MKGGGHLKDSFTEYVFYFFEADSYFLSVQLKILFFHHLSVNMLTRTVKLCFVGYLALPLPYLNIGMVSVYLESLDFLDLRIKVFSCFYLFKYDLSFILLFYLEFQLDAYFYTFYFLFPSHICLLYTSDAADDIGQV